MGPWKSNSAFLNGESHARLVIYSVDCPRETSIVQFNPPKNQKRLWQLTEDDGQYEYSYLEGRWATGKHRKWCGILDHDQFQEFLDHTGLFSENVQTMGSIGVPGCGFGRSPAFSFRSDDEDSIANAYITPLASGSEMAEFLRTVSEEYETDLAIPGILTDSPEQGYLFEGVAEGEAVVAERSIRHAFCAMWGN